MIGSKCNLKTHVQNLGYPFPYKSGVQNHLFEPTLQLKGNFNGLCFRNKTWYRQSVKCADNYKGSPTSSQNVMNFAPKRLKIRSKFLPTFRKFCIKLPTRCTRKPNLTKRCQMVRNKWRWCERNKVAPHSECKRNHRN